MKFTGVFYVKHKINAGKEKYGKPITVYILQRQSDLSEFVWCTTSIKTILSERKLYELEFIGNVINEPDEISKYIQNIKVIKEFH